MNELIVIDRDHGRSTILTFLRYFFFQFLYWIAFSGSLIADAVPLKLIEEISIERSQVQAKELSFNESRLVQDTHQFTEMIIFHANRDASKEPMLGQLMKSLWRGDSDEQVKWLVVTYTTYHAGNVFLRLREDKLPDLHKHIRFHFFDESYSTWARDNYAVYQSSRPHVFGLHALMPATGKGGKQLVRELSGANLQWPIMIERGPGATDGLEELPIPGGDITADDQFVYLGRQSIDHMIKKARFKNEDDVRTYLEMLFKKEIVILSGVDGHSDRYHMPLGMIERTRTNLLADPVKTLELLAALDESEKDKIVQVFEQAYFEMGASEENTLVSFFENLDSEIERLKQSEYVQALEDVEHQLEQRGIRVVRVPTLHRHIHKNASYPLGLYYVNLIQDTYVDRKDRVRHRLVIPEYDIEKLDAHVFQILKSLSHFDVIRRIPANREGYWGAGLRCLVQSIKSPLKSSPES